MNAAVQAPPRHVGIDLADWNWRVVREFVGGRFGVALGHSRCHRYPHRLDFVLKLPRKPPLKHPGRTRAGKREAFVPA